MSELFPMSPTEQPAGSERRASGPPEQEPADPSTDPNLPAWARKPKNAGNPLTEARLAAFIGPRWPKYARKFAAFSEDPSFVPTWNWSAALLPFVWFLFRKLYLAAIVVVVAPGFIVRLLTETDTQLTATELHKEETQWLLLVYVGVWISMTITAGGLGNWLLFRRARAAARIAELQELPDAEALTWLQRVGGVNRSGAILAIAIVIMMMYMNQMA